MGVIHSNSEPGSRSRYRVPRDDFGSGVFSRECAVEGYHAQYQLYGSHIQYTSKGERPDDREQVPVGVSVTHCLEVVPGSLGTALVLHVDCGLHVVAIYVSAAALDRLIRVAFAEPSADLSETTTDVEVATSVSGVWAPVRGLHIVRSPEGDKIGLDFFRGYPEVDHPEVNTVFGEVGILWLPLPRIREAAELVWSRNWPLFAAGLRNRVPAALAAAIVRSKHERERLVVRLPDLLVLLQQGGQTPQEALATVVAALRFTNLGAALTAQDVMDRCLLTAVLHPDAADALQTLLLQVYAQTGPFPGPLGEFKTPEEWVAHFKYPGGTAGAVGGKASSCVEIFTWPDSRDAFGCTASDYSEIGHTNLMDALGNRVGVAGLPACQQALVAISRVPSLMSEISEEVAASIVGAEAGLDALIASKAVLVQQLRTFGAMVTVDYGAGLETELPHTFADTNNVTTVEVRARNAGLPAQMHGPLSAFVLAAIPGKDWHPMGVYGSMTKEWIDEVVPVGVPHPGCAPTKVHDLVVKALTALSAAGKDDASVTDQTQRGYTAVEMCIAEYFSATPAKAELALRLWDLVKDMFSILRYAVDETYNEEEPGRGGSGGGSGAGAASVM